ncbi:spore germination protein [Sutcliffiella deserti]|uniref:spore germination protein n=1 Tax=Sutcliffiella deserti TaxID=2875501 RepID=UPI001CBC7F22|nr:spore germination protein [Sutcliffiella deserti]
MSEPIHTSLEKNITHLKDSFYSASDLSVRKLRIPTEDPFNVYLVYIEGIANTDKIEMNIIDPLLESAKEIELSASYIEDVSQKVIKVAGIKIAGTFAELTDAILDGNTVILIEGYNKGIIAKTADLKERSLEQVTSERSPRGGLVGLTEKLDTNISLLRGMLKTSNFCIDSMDIGSISKTPIAILYIKGIVDQDVLAEVRQRINKLKVNYVLEAKLIEEAMEDKAKTILFTMSETTERPDVINSSLYEGKVVVLVDGNPFGIILPGLFVSALQAPDEYYQKLGRISIRLVRLISFIMTIYIPSIYVVIAKYYVDDLPTNVAETLFKGDELLPPFWSMIILFFLLVVLTDAIFRIPQSGIILVSLLATIAIGETAVTAKLIHPVTLILVAITYLTSLLLANKQMAAPTNTLRTVFLIIGNLFSLPGMIIGTTLLVVYMVTLRSVGVPYLSPIIPFRIEEFKDTFIRSKLEKINNSKHSFPTIKNK